MKCPCGCEYEIDVMAMREIGQEAVRKELNQTHSWKLIRIVCEAISQNPRILRLVKI